MSGHNFLDPPRSDSGPVKFSGPIVPPNVGPGGRGMNLPRKYIAVLRALDGPGEATFDELLARVRPMDEKDLLGTLYVLDSKALIDLSNGDGYASITDVGREVLGR